MGRDAVITSRAYRLFGCAVIGAVACMILVGCTRDFGSTARREETSFSVSPRVAPPPKPTPPEARTSRAQEIEIGKSVGGRPIKAEIYGQGEETILIIATIHGNESAGTPLVRKLGEYLLDNPEAIAGQRVIIVPVANPDGMAANRRTNSRGVDLNRNFPAWNYSATKNHGAAPLSEPESTALHNLIVKHNPKRIITLHQPLVCIDYDGPAEGVARAMASSSRLPLKKLGSLAGSLGSFVGITRKTPIVTVEFARAADKLSAEAIWERYGRMMLVGICYPDSAPSMADGSSRESGASSSGSTTTDATRSGLGN